MINDKNQLILLNDYRNGDYAKSKLKSKISELTREERTLNMIAIGKKPAEPKSDPDVNYYTFSLDNMGTTNSAWSIISDSNPNSRLYITNEENDYSSSSIYRSMQVRVPIPKEKKSDKDPQAELIKKLMAEEEKNAKEKKLKDDIKKFSAEIFIEKLIKHTELIGPRRFDTLAFVWNGDQELFWTGNNTVMSELNNSVGDVDAESRNRNFQVADYRTYWDELIYEFDSVKKEAKGLKKILNVITKKVKKFTSEADKTFASEDPIKIMTFFKDALEELDVSEDSIKKMEDFIVQLSKGKSAPMVARACQKLLMTQCELRLMQDGQFTKYVSEQQAVEFIKKSKRGLCLDLMVDFPRAIPAEVIAKFEHAESLQVFDQYVILHYKPESERPTKTHTVESARKERKEDKKKEIARKKDPILFGLIRGSRKLYYIGDWVDEKCDLTLEKMMAELGQEAFEL